MKKIVFIMFFMTFSILVFGQNMTYSIDFKSNMSKLNVAQNTTVLVFQNYNNNYKLVSGEAFGLPKNSENEIVIIDNLKMIKYIEANDENGNVKKVSIESGETVKSDHRWSKLVYFNNDGQKVGEQNFNTIF